ncbi:DNA-directed RNA polymerases I, II, and III subunit RPABC4, variant 2 [Entomophthora muscae]|uniref:DNA-directed RNA polymerases I, II, and III subunit RPABC4, variant 2 n=1 Tax=Entomophthora muscae TaxID=34485 RepID=A0ACC2SUZ6_9FUNG|nr:DNA-directed RNA polymerases I, II, and III subunit RPABC4, variant 2 [Entomophthora muscae]
MNSVPATSSGNSYLVDIPAGLNPEHFKYDCSQCGEETTLRTRDQIRCLQCGCRVLFKKRTKRSKWF